MPSCCTSGVQIGFTLLCHPVREATSPRLACAAAAMDYEQANEAAAVEQLHPALQETEEPGAKRQRLDGDATY